MSRSPTPLRARFDALLNDGNFAAGERLTEVSIAEMLGVSRTPVRELLQSLIAEGLAVDAGRGVFVETIDHRQLFDLMHTRAVLEGLAASTLARRVERGDIAPSSLRRLRALALRTRELTVLGDDDATVEMNVRFHLGIAELSANVEVERMLRQLARRVQICTTRTLADRHRRSTVDDEHDSLLDAIETGDAPSAEALARRHVVASIPTAMSAASKIKTSDPLEETP